MIRVNQIKLPVKHTREQLIKKTADILKSPADNIKSVKIVKQSIDARKKEDILYIYAVDVEMENEAQVIRRAKNVNVMISREKEYIFPVPGSKKYNNPPVIAGSGPAGLFCALMLARSGCNPVILERGDDVDTRTSKVSSFWRGGPLDINSNVQFGEGGAGTFSDGKLNTLVKDTFGRNKKVLEIFTEFGADASILYKNKPHIGTDVLSLIVKNIRNEIISLGGEVRFNSRVTDFFIENDRLTEIEVNNEYKMPVEVFVLAIGHSARDTFETLYKRGVLMEKKAFAVGLRIQHPQDMINKSQYGSGNADILGAADYKLTKQCSNGRGVYSFCMCPGGYVVNASSENEMLAVNGMSNHARDGKNANSALIVTVTPEDFSDSTPLAGIAFQRKLERLAYKYGDGRIPVQLYGDFKEKRMSRSLGEIEPQTMGLYEPAPLHEILPEYITASLIEGIEAFGRMIKGFERKDSILAGIESRTSSPVRILRDERLESKVKGMFPCGEGAGYAGGITSAAMDGIKTAEEIVRRLT